MRGSYDNSDAKAAVESERTIKNTGKKENSVRYYIGSKKATEEELNNDIRSHRPLKTNYTLYWMLDVTCKEDAGRKRKGNSAANFALFSKIALALIQKCEKNLTPSKKTTSCT